MNVATARKPTPAQPQRRLGVVPPPALRAPRAPFVIVIVAILAIGLVGLLLLNTALAQGSFQVHDLQRQTAALQDREQQLQIAVDAANNPARLAAAAHHLGLVPAQDPGFIRLSDGRVLGAPHAATAAPKKPAATASTQPSPNPSANASPNPAAKPAATPVAKPGASAAPKPSAKPSPHASAAPKPRPTPRHG